jgi:hypothetical protein
MSANPDPKEVYLNALLAYRAVARKAYAAAEAEPRRNPLLPNRIDPLVEEALCACGLALDGAELAIPKAERAAFFAENNIRAALPDGV